MAARKKAAEAKAAWERCDQEAAWERREQEEVKAQVTRCEAHAKTLVLVGEPIVMLDLGSDIEPGVGLLGVTNLVIVWLRKFFFLKLIWLVGPSKG